MSAPTIVWIIVGTATLLALVVFLIQLLRQMKRLLDSVVQFNQEVQPVLRSIQEDAAVAQERSAKIQEQSDSLREMREEQARKRSSRARARR